jgi:hypothetical protein
MKWVFCNVVLLCFLHCTRYGAYAQSVPSAELINNATQYDKKVVSYAGEVIGEVMARGEYAWVNVHDKVNAIGVWARKDLIQDISYAGGYQSLGDSIEVQGTFHRSCSEHGGDLDIHALSLRKIKDGRIIEQSVDILKRNEAVGLLGVVCLILIVWRLRRR